MLNLIAKLKVVSFYDISPFLNYLTYRSGGPEEAISPCHCGC